MGAFCEQCRAIACPASRSSLGTTRLVVASCHVPRSQIQPSPHGRQFCTVMGTLAPSHVVPSQIVIHTVAGADMCCCRAVLTKRLPGVGMMDVPCDGHCVVGASHLITQPVHSSEGLLCFASRWSHWTRAHRPKHLISSSRTASYIGVALKTPSQASPLLCNTAAAQQPRN